MIIDWNFIHRIRSQMPDGSELEHHHEPRPQHLVNQFHHKANVKARQRSANKVARASRRANR